MSRNAQQLEIVKHVFAQRELEFAQRLSKFQTMLNQSSAQLKQLTDHRDSQLEKLHHSQSTDPGRLQNQHAFQRNLDNAIKQQETLIARAKEEQDHLRKLWLARRSKTQAVNKLYDQRIAQEQSDENYREQKQQDERSQLARPRAIGSEPLG